MKTNDGRFKPGNKVAEKWTEEKALELGEQLIDWMKEEDMHIFYEDFLCVENDYYPDLIGYLSNKFPPFSDLLKRAEKIQEMKLVKLGVADKIQTTMTIFCLKNHHGYKDKREISGGLDVTDFSKLSTDELKERAAALNTIDESQA